MQKKVMYEHVKQNKVAYITCSLLLLLIPLLVFISKHHVERKPTISQAERRNNRVEGQLTIKYKTGVTAEQIVQSLAYYQAKIIDNNTATHWITVQVPKDKTDLILNNLSRDNLIEKAEPNYIYHSTSIPNDPLYTKQYHLKNTGQDANGVRGTAGADIKIEQAWDVTQGNGIKVAVVDSGINLNHEDLQNKVIAQKSFVKGDTSVEDGAGHGTENAGILAATTNNGIGVAGVCPGCKLIIARSTDDDANGTTASIANGITWSADQGAQIINMSLGGDEPGKALEDAVNYAIQKGAILVGAAGNCGDNNFADSYCGSQNPKFYPAAYPGVIAVAATDNTDKRYTKSSYGTWVKIAAPGTAVFATVPNHAVTQTDTRNYDFYSGTSQAAPQVSGVLALLLATGLSRDAAIQRMYATADKIAGTGTAWQYGRLNAGKALAQAVQPTTVPTKKPLPTQPAVANPTVKPAPTTADQAPAQGGSGSQLEPNPTCPFATLGGQPCITQGVTEPTTVPDSAQIPQQQQPLPKQNLNTGNGGLLGLLLLLLQLLTSLFGAKG